MMRERIAVWLALFADRLGRDLSDPTLAAYMAAIEGYGLSLDEFERAAGWLFERERFLPPPIEFLYAARPDARPGTLAKQVRALVIGAIVNMGQPGVSSHFGVSWSRIPEHLREAAREAWSRAGGNADQLQAGQDFGFTRRFEEAFVEQLVERPRLELRAPLQLAGGVA